MTPSLAIVDANVIQFRPPIVRLRAFPVKQFGLPILGTGHEAETVKLARIGGLDGNFAYLVGLLVPVPALLGPPSRANTRFPDGWLDTTGPTGVYQCRETFDLNVVDP
jgi:hypothetical protein